jgi:hypothetical protein
LSYSTSRPQNAQLFQRFAIEIEIQLSAGIGVVTGAQFDKETGDLILQFTENVKLQVFAFRGHEVWEIHFADGTGEYSNFAK